MKKIFILATIITFPAFAATTDATKLYGDTANINATAHTDVTPVAQNVEPQPTADALQEETLAPATEPAAVSKTTEKYSEPTEKFESRKTYSFESSNPDIKFPHGLQLGVGVSVTGGLDGFVGYNNKKFDSFWWKRFGVRLGYASTKPFKSFINNKLNSFLGDGKDIGDYVTVHNGQIEAKHMFAVIDFYPFGDTWFLGGMRLSGGYYNGDLKLTADLTAKHDVLAHDAEFKLGDTWYKYTAGDKQGLAVANWNVSGPYAGLGFDLGMFYGFKLYMDAGVVFTSESAKLDLQIAEASLKQSTNNGVTWNDVDTSALQTNKTQALADAQKELDKYTYYPIVKMGFMYRF